MQHVPSGFRVTYPTGRVTLVVTCVRILAIARDLGECELAEQLDVQPAVVDKVLASARERLNTSTITARRMRANRDRWADVDRYYEALGSRPRISPRRPIPPEP